MTIYGVGNFDFGGRPVLALLTTCLELIPKNRLYLIVVLNVSLLVLHQYFSIGIGGIGLFLWYRVVVLVSVKYSRYLPTLITHKISTKIFCYVF